jgi:hypothetical protein
VRVDLFAAISNFLQHLKCEKFQCIDPLPKDKPILNSFFFVTACQCSIIATGVALEALDRCVDLKTLNGHVIFDYSFLEKG